MPDEKNPRACFYCKSAANLMYHIGSFDRWVCLRDLYLHHQALYEQVFTWCYGHPAVYLIPEFSKNVEANVAAEILRRKLHRGSVSEPAAKSAPTLPVVPN